MQTNYEEAFEKQDKGFVSYEDFGAAGDGKADDFPAIKRAHAYANKRGLPVESDPRHVYYIAPSPEPAIIMTDTDWGSSRFIIDDKDIPPDDCGHAVFHVKSALAPVSLSPRSLKKNQAKIDVNLPGNALVLAINEDFRQYRRMGLNVDNGHPQTDCFIVDQTGYVLTPIIWDFEKTTSLTAYPIDPKILTIKGGLITTIANRAPSEYTYYERNIFITRSNVIMDGMVHTVEGEIEHGGPYYGIVRSEACAHGIFKNCFFTGRFIYETIGAAKLPVKMGSYDISLWNAVDVSFINCRQDNIMDRRYWGLFGSNYCKDIVIEGCTFSRVDAHMGVTNYTIRNCEIGHQGLNAIGHGRMLVENVLIHGGGVVNLRGDYGSTWQGDLVMRNITWYPASRESCLINSNNSGGHDFGYPCAMPRKITIENLNVMDADVTGDGYEGINLIQIHPETNGEVKSFGPQGGKEDSPYTFTEILRVDGARTQSGKGFKLFSNTPHKVYAARLAEPGEAKIQTNFTASFNDVDRLSIKLPSEAIEYSHSHHLVPGLDIKNCSDVSIDKGSSPAVIRREP